jgi:uncharacterized membrane protein YcaP (DUF421 family)
LNLLLGIIFKYLRHEILIIMKKEDIHLSDIQRILLGEAPASFLLEVFVRTVLIYLMLLIAVRLMGKRMSGQLTIAEMAVMLTLGAIVSPAMQIPNVGLLQGILILVLALAFQRGLNWLEFRNEKLEELTHGKVTMLVKNGSLILTELDKAKMSRQQLFAVLRNASIFNLGDVERVYLESFGMFSVYKFAEARPGLSILPPQERLIGDLEKHNNTHLFACTSCGHVEEKGHPTGECPVCSSESWLKATISI